MSCQLDQLACGDAILFVGLMRMGADGAIDIRKAIGDRKQRRKPLDARRDGDDAPDARRLGARDNGVEILGKVLEVEMTVAVDEHLLLAVSWLFRLDITREYADRCRQARARGQALCAAER